MGKAWDGGGGGGTFVFQSGASLPLIVAGGGGGSGAQGPGDVYGRAPFARPSAPGGEGDPLHGVSGQTVRGPGAITVHFAGGST